MRSALLMTVSILTVAGIAPAVSTWAAEAVPEEAANEIVVSATRSAKTVADAPATVSLITAEQMDDQLVTDIKDLIRYEPGVTVRNAPSRFTAAGASTGRDGNSGFNIRGIEGNRVLIQIDGIRVPDAFSFGGQNAGRGGYADLDVLKSVEILRGPASALYGSDGVAGAVSFTTRDPIDFLKGEKTSGGQVKAAYSEADESWSKGFVIADKAGANWSSMLAYNRRDGHEQATAGENDAPNSTRTTANPQEIGSNSVLAKLVYSYGDGNRVRLTYDHFDQVVDTDVLSARTASTSSLIAHDTSGRDRVSLDYRWTGEGFIQGIDAVVYAQSATSSQWASEDRTTLADRIRINDFDTTVAGANVDFTSRATTGTITHLFTYGLDVSTTKQTSLRDGTVPPAGETFPTRAFPTTDYIRGGLFMQDEIVAGRLTLYPALRFDSYTLTPRADALLTGFTPQGQDGSHVSPKLGLIYRFTPQFGLFLNAGEGFKAPTPGEVNNAFANPISNYRTIPNPDLKPETSQTLEAGLRYNSSRLSGSVTVFSSKYDDFIEQVLIGGSFTPADPAIYQFVNLTQVEISGVEARGRADLGHGFTLNLAASTARGDNIATHTPLASVEPWKAVAGLSWRSGSRFGGALNVTHSAQKEADRLGVTCAPSCYIPDAFTVVDVTAFWNITPELALRAGIFNLTDEKYMWWSDGRGLSTASTVIDAYTQPGRKASVSLAYRF